MKNLSIILASMSSRKKFINRLLSLLLFAVYTNSTMFSQLVEPEFSWTAVFSNFSDHRSLKEITIDEFKPSKRLDCDSQIGELFANIKSPKRSVKSKKVSIEECVVLNFIEYSTNQNEGYHGLIMYPYAKVIEDFASENRFTLGEPFLFLSPKEYKTSNPSDAVVSVYAVSTVDNPQVMIDTCFVVNVNLNHSKKNSDENFKPYFYLKSDMLEKGTNIYALEKWRADRLHQKRLEQISDGFNDSESSLFPQDSIYIYGINYKVNTLNSEYESLQYKWNNKTQKIKLITNETEIHTSSIAFSNSSDKVYVKDNLTQKFSAVHGTEHKDDNRMKNYDMTFESSLDSVWLIKAIALSDFYDLTVRLGSYITNNQVDINIDEFVLSDEDEYNSIDFWETWVDESDSLGLVDYNLYLKILPVMKTREKTVIVGGATKKEIVETDVVNHLEFVCYDHTFYKNEPKQVLEHIAFLKNTEEQMFFLGNKYDPRINTSEFVVQYDSYSLYPIGLDSTNIKRCIALHAFTKYKNELFLKNKNEADEEDAKLRDIAWEKKKKEDESKEKAERQKLNNKYGKKYVDAAYDFDVIIGMHEDLLAYSLTLWSLESKDEFNNGYSLYLYSKLDTSVHLYVTVINKKVTRVSVW